MTTVEGRSVVAYDFTWGWRGAIALLQHRSPYELIQPTGPYPFDSAFKYPLPYAVLSLPFARLSPISATAAFGGVGAALFAFALTQFGYWRLPLLASAPVVATLLIGQSSLWLAAGALLPSLAWMGFCIKPTGAIIGLAYKPRFILSAVVGTLVASALSLLLVPTWPLDWLRAMFNDPATHWYIPAIRILPLGPLLLLAASKWRTAEGRLLLAAALIPQNQSFYSGVFPLLVARTYRECLILALISDLGSLTWLSFAGLPADRLDPIHQAPWLVAFMYVPALLLVLLRPNVASS